MLRPMLASAALTGLFCAIFAAGVDTVTGALSLWQVMGAGAISGFFGSLFAQTVLKSRMRR